MGWFTDGMAQEAIKKGLLTHEQVYGVKEVAQLTTTAKSTTKQKPANLSTSGPCQSLWIPNWTPALLNQWDGQHWSKRSKLKKADATIVAAYFRGSGLEPARGPRRVSLLFVLPKGKRMFDEDASEKSVRDALVHCSALVDDTPRLARRGSIGYARALIDCQVGTLILLEDLA